MAEEIERKFFIHSPSDVQRLLERLAFATQKVLIKQGYLNTDGPTTRVRIADQHATLTIKGKRNKKTGAKPEFEYGIPVDDASKLMVMCEPRIIVKTRYSLALDKLLQLEASPASAFKEIEGVPLVYLEVDIFHGLFTGLVYVEVERPEDLTDEQWENLPLPEWISNNEVTGMKGFSNRHLAEFGNFPRVPEQFVSRTRK